MTAITQGEHAAGQAGTPCPPWCTTDHAGGTRRFHAGPSWYSNHPFEYDCRYLSVYAVSFPGDAAEVALQGTNAGDNEHPGLWLQPQDAIALAAIVEMLQGRGDSGMRELAAQLRAAAGLAAGAQ